jgi:Putative peptidoglycan binding domain
MSSRLLVWFMLSSLACTHARKVDDASDQSAAKVDDPGEPAAPEQQAADPQAAGSRKGLIAGGEKDPERVPVASSPAGLLKPGAEQKVREKLGLNAKGEELRPALQRFQREHDLPATGILDHRTAKELGLDPDELFERAQD